MTLRTMNILFLMTDQQHADALGFRGHPLVQTPNLDALAAKGVHFERMFTCTAICGPSRTSFFTGAYPRTHEHFMNSGDLRRDMPSLLTALKAGGYQTFQCGKDHLPPAISRHFDERHAHSEYEADLKARGIADTPLDETLCKNFLSARSQLPEEEQCEVWTANHAIRFLASPRATERPFFMWCSFLRPHAPHMPPARFDDLYDPEDIPVDWEDYERFENSRMQNRPMVEDFWKIGAVRHDPRIFQKAVCRYLALITFIDEQIGRVLAALEAHGHANNTLVVFTSDHGDWAGNYGQLGKNLPGYDHLLRIPLIYHDPQRPGDSGRSVGGLYQSIDLMPTLLQRLNLPVPPTVQGESFLPALDGRPGSGRPFIFAETSMEKTIRSPDWKLTFFLRHPERGQLFRMGSQPDETTNHWDDPSCALIKQRLLLELLAWMARCEQPGSMDASWEEYVDTPWYAWLARQPKQACVPTAGPTV
jgi:arylsulfatase A-like enzyme